MKALESMRSKADAGARQRCVGGGAVVAQEFAQWRVVGQGPQRAGKAGFAGRDLGPGGVEQMIGEGVDAGLEDARAAAGALVDAEAVAIRNKQVEAL